MNVAIIGSGAVGKTYGFLLDKAGNDVHFLLHSEYEFIKKEKQFIFRFNDSEMVQTLLNPNIYCSHKKMPSPELIVIALKTTENHLLAEILPSLARPESIVLIIQNGIGNEEYVHNILPNNPILCGITTIGAKINLPGNVLISHLGELRLAPFNPHQTNICEKIRKAFLASDKNSLQVEIVADYKQIRWEKLLWNIPFNSLSTLCNRTVDILAKKKPYQIFIRQLMSEIIEIATSEQIFIPETRIESLLGQTAKLIEFFPSMHQDFVNSRPIERKFIVENALQIGLNNNLSLPLLTFISDGLKRLESGQDNPFMTEENLVAHLLQPF